MGKKNTNRMNSTVGRIKRYPVRSFIMLRFICSGNTSQEFTANAENNGCRTGRKLQDTAPADYPPIS
jgi:hypothetical protein